MATEGVSLAEGAGGEGSLGPRTWVPGRRACGPRRHCCGASVSPSVEWGCTVPRVPGSGVGPVTASVFTSCVTKSTVTLWLNQGPVLS